MSHERKISVVTGKLKNKYAEVSGAECGEKVNDDPPM
jgi:hypothetical protein